MKTKRFITIALIFIMSLNFMVMPTLASSVTPRWENIYFVDIVHGPDNGKACCYIYINAYDGTDRIDNVDIKLYQKVGSSLILVARWDDLSSVGDEFEFYGEADNAPAGYTYRLAITADVHRYGYVERLDTYGDIAY